MQGVRDELTGHTRSRHEPRAMTRCFNPIPGQRGVWKEPPQIGLRIRGGRALAMKDETGRRPGR